MILLWKYCKAQKEERIYTRERDEILIKKEHTNFIFISNGMKKKEKNYEDIWVEIYISYEIEIWQ